jgi:2-oxoglutarate dehydrogenase complex dehydrogenase (E1) component-like enzyme
MASACCIESLLSKKCLVSVKTTSIMFWVVMILSAGMAYSLLCFQLKCLQYMHIPNREQCNWLRERIELSGSHIFPPEEKRLMLDRLAWSEMFETFLANKYAAAKRFGLEGAESLVPGMKALIDRAADLGAQNIVIGMPHRGRLNILGNVVRKPLRQIFTEFGGKQPLRTGADQYHGACLSSCS